MLLTWSRSAEVHAAEIKRAGGGSLEKSHWPALSDRLSHLTALPYSFVRWSSHNLSSQGNLVPQLELLSAQRRSPYIECGLLPSSHHCRLWLRGCGRPKVSRRVTPTDRLRTIDTRPLPRTLSSDFLVLAFLRTLKVRGLVSQLSKREKLIRYVAWICASKIARLLDGITRQ